MGRDNNAWSYDYFSRVFRDLTPASLPVTTRVLFAPPSDDSQVSVRCASLLSDDEWKRAQRFASEGERSRYVQGRAFYRFCATMALDSPGPLSRIDFAATDKGRPYIRGFPDLRFSFSSTRVGMLGAWSTTHGIGVDLEDDTRRVAAVDLARSYFSESERLVLQRLASPEREQSFFRHWCLKEAALKSIGQGLPAGLDAFEFDLQPGPRVLSALPGKGGAERFAAYLIDGTGHCAAMVLHDRARVS